MRMEQSGRNGGKDEIKFELAMLKVQKLFRIIEKRT